MGEFSKLVGDVGEGIVSHFLELFGWENHAANKYVKCHTRKHDKESHGIDALFVYNSPLESNTIENIVVSSKYSSNSYARVLSTFKSHFEDIATAIECYAKSQLKRDVNDQVISSGNYGSCRKVDTGVLFYINNEERSEEEDIIGKVKNSQINSSLKFRAIHLIDNKRASFLYESIKYIKNKYGSENVNFFYPPTSLNLINTQKKYFGKIFPVEYISSPVLPIVIEKNNQEQPIFCLMSCEPFSFEVLESLVACARDLVADISKNLLFVFKEYNKLNAKEDVDNLLLAVGKDVIINIEAYRVDFRG